MEVLGLIFTGVAGSAIIFLLIRFLILPLFSDENDSFDKGHFNNGTNETEIVDETIPTPQISSAEVHEDGVVIIDWYYGSEVDTFEAEYRISDLYNWVELKLDESENWGSDDQNKKGAWLHKYDTKVSNGQVRLRAKGDDGVSKWSGVVDIK